MFHHHELQIHPRETQGIAIFDLHGKIELGSGDLALREFVESFLGQGNRRLILDLARVSAMDSAGAGVLLLLAREYRDAEGRLALLAVDRVHSEIYEMARLEAVVEIYTDEIDAVNSFFPDRKTPHYDILEYVESQQHEEDPSQDDNAKN